MSEPLQLSRRNFILTALAAAGQAIPATAWAATQPPNIVFILADDMGYGDPGVYGQLKIKTPYIDKLAAEGMRFTQGYAGAPVCAPSRCALMTACTPGTRACGITSHSPPAQWATKARKRFAAPACCHLTKP